MDIKTNSISNLPTSFLAASVATILLFISIPLLTKISTIQPDREEDYHVLINPRKPQPPPELEQEEKLEEIKKQKTPEKKPLKQPMPQPRLDIPTNSLNPNMPGTIPMNNLLNQDIKVSESRFVTAYGLNEVDKSPTPVRKFQPRYPFEAQQKGIEGKVLVRCVIDSTGMPQEPEIYSVEPKEVEGVFDEAALECIMKFKFKPAMKGGEPVDCIVRVPFTFSVTE